MDYPPVGGAPYYHYSDSVTSYHIDRVLRARRVGSRMRRRISDALKPLSVRVATELARVYGAEFCPDDLVDGWTWILSMRMMLLPVFRRWIRTLRPKLVVTVVNYDQRNLILCEAAHLEGVKIAELQHGEIDIGHPAYNLPERTDVYSPDWLFAWGRFWIEQTSNYALRASLPLGYPYLESALARYSWHGSQRKTVVFISQGTIGEALSALAVRVRAHLPQEEYRIVYKLHPSETLCWRQVYQELAAHGRGIEVVGNDDCSLYECLSEADCLVGSDSTALMEGFAWGLKTFVLSDFARADIMAQFEKVGAVEFIKDSDDLVAKLRGQELGPSGAVQAFSQSLWQTKASERIAAAINERIRQ